MLNIILIVLFILGQTFIFFRKTNILQNQYYSFKRYLLYKKEHFLSDLFFYFIVVLSLCFSLLNKYFLIIIPLIQFYYQKNKIKKFKITKRITRQLVVFEMLNGANLLFLLMKNVSFLIVLYNYLIYWLSFSISLLIEKIILQINIKKAQEKIQKQNLIIIGITGSYGKTSCKNYLYEMLKNHYHVLLTPQSYNTLNGLLLTINNYLKPNHEIFIAEIGLDHPKSIEKYFKVFTFDIGLVTTIGPQHLKTFKNINNIALEKNKLLQHSKMAIINLDDPLIAKDNLPNKKIYFSVLNNKNAQINVQINHQEITKTYLDIKIDNNLYQTYTILLGKHNITNLAAVIAIAKALNIPDESILKTINKLTNVPHRLSQNKVNNITILDDSYNSNFQGFLSALEVLSSANNFKILITPGIIEKNKNIQQDEILANKINEICDEVLLIKQPSFQDKIINKLSFNSFIEAYNYVLKEYQNQEITILIENDVPDIYLK